MIVFIAINAPNPRTAKITQRPNCGIKGWGQSAPEKILQTNPIQVRVFKAEGEVNPLQRGGHTPAPQPSPGVIIPTREVLISYPS